MNIVTDVILPLALAFIMFVLGLGLTGTDFLRVIKQPRDFFVGAFLQIILLPIVAFILLPVRTTRALPIITGEPEFKLTLLPVATVRILIPPELPKGAAANDDPPKYIYSPRVVFEIINIGLVSVGLCQASVYTLRCSDP